LATFQPVENWTIFLVALTLRSPITITVLGFGDLDLLLGVHIRTQNCHIRNFWHDLKVTTSEHQKET